MSEKIRLELLSLLVYFNERRSEWLSDKNRHQAESNYDLASYKHGLMDGAELMSDAILKILDRNKVSHE